MLKLLKLLKEELELTSVLYHATYKPLLDKIKKYGLDSKKAEKSWDDSKSGVIYLAKDRDVAASYAEIAENVPDEWFDKIIILHIDVNQLDKSKFYADSNVIDGDESTLEYWGVIPWSAITKIEQY